MSQLVLVDSRINLGVTQYAQIHLTNLGCIIKTV